MNALLVEDSPVIRDRLIPMLDALAAVRVVATAETEHEASDWLAAHDCDIVLVDLLLRQGSGFGLLARLRDHDALRVVITNNPSPEARRRCEELGASAFFDKSNQLDELFDYLRSRATSFSQ